MGLYLAIAWSTAMAGTFSGTGTISDPYQVKNYTDLQNIESDLTAHYRIVNDIDASVSQSGGFIPIGEKARFQGSLEGGGFSITHLIIKGTVSPDSIGLFKHIDTSGVVDSILLHVEIEGDSIVGGIAAVNNGTISNSVVHATIKGNHTVGIFVGVNDGLITNSHSKGMVFGADSIVGGITGINKQTIEESVSYAKVDGVHNIGGIAGINKGSIVLTSSTGSVDGRAQVGGLVGWNEARINKSFSSATVKGGGNVGGLVGFQYRGTIENCYSSGFVDASYAGGLIGTFYSGVVKSSYTVSRSRYIEMGWATMGAAHGHAYYDVDKCKVEGVYWSSEIASWAWYSNTGIYWDTITTDLSKDQFSLKSSFKEFDFDSIWVMKEGTGFPELRGLTNAPFGINDTSSEFTDNSSFTGYLSNDIMADEVPITVYQLTGYSEIPGSNDDIMILYRPGVIYSNNDTVWGGAAYITSPFDNEITLSSYDDLKKIGNDWKYPLNGKYTLTNDINARDSKYENSGLGFEPIGSFEGKFEGTFDGAGYRIYNLYINRPTKRGVGLFSVLSRNATIMNIGIDGDITGRNSVGILAGSYSTEIGDTITIKNTYTNGKVMARGRTDNDGYDVGRFVGETPVSGVKIQDSYSTALLMKTHVNNYNEMEEFSFSAGELEHTSSDVLRKLSPVVTNVFALSYNIIFDKYYRFDRTDYCLYKYTSEGPTSIELEDTLSIKNHLTRDSISWDLEQGYFPSLKAVNDPPMGVPDRFATYHVNTDLEDVLVNDYDAENDSIHTAQFMGYSYLNSTRDSLSLLYRPGSVLKEGDTLWGGMSYAIAPWDTMEISSYEDLKKIGNHWNYPLNGVYKLTQNINAINSRYEADGKGFLPIGNAQLDSVLSDTVSGAFMGSLNGNGHVIYNLYINRPDEDRVGLFRDINGIGEVSNVGISGSITGRNYVGALAGESQRHRYLLSNVYNSATITGKKYVGGLVGNSQTPSYNSYNTGIVKGNTYVGGLFGDPPGIATKSYSIGRLTGDDAGGVFGDNYGPTDPHSYWNIALSKSNVAHSGTSLTSSKMKQEGSYEKWDFTDIWGIKQDVSYPYLRNMVNAPIAVEDSLVIKKETAITVFLHNDFDFTLNSLPAIISIDSIKGAGSIKDDTLFSFTENIDKVTASVIYRAGTILSNGDTLWGNQAFAELTNHINDRPIAHDDSYSMNEDDVLAIERDSFLENDSDVDLDSLSFKVIGEPSNGECRWSSWGIYYEPSPDWNGTDTIIYSISDGEYFDTAQVVVTVLPVDDPILIGELPAEIVYYPKKSLGEPILTIVADDIDRDPITYDVAGIDRGSIKIIDNQLYLADSYVPPENGDTLNVILIGITEFTSDTTEVTIIIPTSDVSLSSGGEVLSGSSQSKDLIVGDTTVHLSINNSRLGIFSYQLNRSVFSIEAQGDYHVKIYTILGNLVMEVSGTGPRNFYNRETLTESVYVLVFESITSGYSQRRLISVK